MRHHMYNPEFKFVVEPEHFDKYTDRELLQYCPGATMYMPGFKDFTPKILDHSMPGLTTMVLCFEDACPEDRVPEAMENVHHLLSTVADAVDSGELDPDYVPLIFVRVRNVRQFKEFGDNLTKKEVRFLCGVNFPKFNLYNGEGYFSYL
ncbi:MAG: HpcH/HpaI aldolase/citrate lyase family protein, partial [Oscillospiraceae bacterium]|nr:HpcH/HpaI aldolase/citrate lyase family protein [Oscillospiraceae bacterium]